MCFGLTGRSIPFYHKRRIFVHLLTFFEPRDYRVVFVIQKIKSPDCNVVTLDDLNEHNIAQTDPEMFLSIHKTPILIDEIQYAPALFSYIKMTIDKGAPAGNLWLTGSQSFKLMELAEESLAG